MEQLEGDLSEGVSFAMHFCIKFECLQHCDACIMWMLCENQFR